MLIALGSNLGNRVQNLTVALNKMNEQLGPILRVSNFSNTTPIGGPSQEDFLNATLVLKTRLSPIPLLKKILEIEQEMGRIRFIKWGPRLIDLDLIFFEQEILQEKDLILPHPLAHQRLFVLEPATQIAPEWVHPVFHRTIAELYREIKQVSWQEEMV